jgi:hypothetical protein
LAFGEHSVDPQALLLYSGNIVAIGVARTLVWWYVSRRYRLIDADVARNAVRQEIWRAVMVPLVFLLSMPLAVWAPRFMSLCWLLILPLSLIARRRAAGSAEPSGED